MAKTFCGCVQLRTGCIVIAIIKVMASFWMYLLLLCPFSEKPGSEGTGKENVSWPDIHRSILILMCKLLVFILHTIFGIISGSCLLAEVTKKHKNRCAIMTYMVLEMINIVMELCIVIVICIIWSKRNHEGYAAVLVSCFGIYMCISICFWIGVCRLYKVTEERSRPHSYLKDEIHEMRSIQRISC